MVLVPNKLASLTGLYYYYWSVLLSMDAAALELLRFLGSLFSSFLGLFRIVPFIEGPLWLFYVYVVLLYFDQ